MNNHGGSKAEAVVKLTLIFFISLFSFSVGTFVGKQVSDSDRRRVALEAEYEDVQKTAQNNKEEMKGAISEDDVDQLTKEFVEAEKELSKHKQQKADREVASTKQKEPAKAVTTDDGFVKRSRSKDAEHSKGEMHDHAAKDHKPAPQAKAEKKFKPGKVLKAVNRVAKGKAPTPNIVKKRSLASTLPALSPTSIGKYTVQISSYATEKEAKAHAKKLKADGYSAFYLSAKVKSKTWYRVSVGLFDSRKSANNFKTELMKQASISSAIVQKIIR